MKGTRSHSHLYTPYWFPIPQRYHQQALSDLQHRCSATAGHFVIDALISVHDTPHFGFVQGYVKGREIYSSYISGEIEQFDVMVENHALKAFEQLIVYFRVHRYGGCFPHPLVPSLTLRSLILVQRPSKDSTEYTVVDGIHRAALLAADGVSMVNVVILKPKVEVEMEEYMPSNTDSKCMAKQHGNSAADIRTCGLHALY
jgi:hypothetical protein